MKENLEHCKGGTTENTAAEFGIWKRTLIIAPSGDLDHHTAVLIREQADSMVERYCIRDIIFDMERVHFMDSSGIGVIMGRYKKVIFGGGNVAVANVQREAERIFKMTGLYKIIDRYETLEEAISDGRN